jgi:uncharacterized protein with NRDE domain
MCTIILVYKTLPSHPVIVAGNRDEFLQRTACAPHVWKVPAENHPSGVFAGKDLREGGTWLGVNPYGLVVGVTNRYTGKREPDKASRGQLVLRCLEQDSVEKILETLTPAEASRYNPFNLFCLSEEAGCRITHDPEGFHKLPLDEGFHILTNRAPDDPKDPKRDWLRSRLYDLPPNPDAVISRFSRLLASHGKGDPSAHVCVHLPGYGTVSSYMLFLASRRDESRYLYAPGPPCQNRYQDLTAEFLALFAVEKPGIGSPRAS